MLPSSPSPMCLPISMIVAASFLNLPFERSSWGTDGVCRAFFFFFNFLKIN